MIAIIDYGVGNLFSLKSSLASIGADAVITSDESVIRSADKIILPGVGAFGDAIAKLRATGLDKVVTEEAERGKPLLGICLGMQLLFDKSFEFGEYEGLGLIKGEIRPIADVIPADFKIPHIGWNALHLRGKSPIFKYLKEGDFVYFVHSFYAADCDESVIATAEYGAELTAAAARDNVYGCQFHPEKSGSVGLSILKAFCELGEKKEMKLFPAIDLYEGKAVRLLRGDYNAVTVYADDPLVIAKDFEACGAECLHLVDLEGAKSGETPNIDVVKRIVENTSLFTEVGGGIRSMDVVKTYLDAGVDRVILGTAAVTDEAFLREALAAYGDKIAVGVDIKDGYAAIKGWTENSGLEAVTFCEKLEKMGVSTVICTDISKDGAMQGTNHDLYHTLSKKFGMNITASGGVSSLDDIEKLSKTGLYGAIIGKAYYTGAIDLREAVKLVKEAK